MRRKKDRQPVPDGKPAAEASPEANPEAAAEATPDTAAEATPKPQPSGKDRVYVGTGFYWPVLLGLIVALAILALVLQNTQRVEVHWLWLDFRVPLIALLLATGLSATLLTELVGWIWRRRRRRALRDREELKRLRG